MMIDLVCNILQTVIDGLQSSKSDASGGRQLVINVETITIENFHASNPELAADEAAKQLVSRLPWKKNTA